MANAGIPQEAMMAALQAVHKTGVNTDPSTGAPYDQAAATGQTAGGGPSDPNAGADPNADPNAQGPPSDPTEQAVWDRFPSTDPQAVQQLASGGPDALATYIQQAQQDRDEFNQMQESMAQQLLSMIGGGAPDQSTAEDQGAPAPPMVGGGGAGY